MTTNFWLSIPFSNFVRRGIAYLADCTLVVAVYLFSQVLVLTPIRNLFDTSWMQSGPRLELYILLTISLPTWLYFALTERSAWQASLGKRLVGLRVVDAISGRRITFGQALLRTVIKLLPWELAHLSVTIFSSNPTEMPIGVLVACLLFVGSGVAVLLMPRNRGVHDLVARTAVVRQ
ncbi:MAG TPA: RDD family protein [Herpetosiphonaceae bacterium]